MKTILAAIALTAFAFPVFAADVGVSLSVGQPGVYGQIDIGNTPRPQLVYSRPVMMAPARLAVAPALPRVQRLRAAGLFRSRPLVQQRLCASLQRTSP